MGSGDGVYKRKDREGYWISWIDAQGRRRSRKTDAQTIAQAKSIRAAELIKVEHSKVLGFSPPGEETFQEVTVRFLLHQKARLTVSAYEREKGIIEKHLCPFFVGKIAAIRRVDVQRYITMRSGDVSTHTVQKELNVLKHLLSLALEWEIIPINPAQGIKSPRVPAGRIRYLQPTELKVVMEHCPQWLYPVVGIAVNTGMRRSEILNLRWLDVDLTHNRILLPQTKNGSGRIVYLNRFAQAVLLSLPCAAHARPTDKVFPDLEPAKVSMAFHRACSKAEIVDFRFHDLRHTAASWLRMAGADIHTVAQLLGHKDLRMAARYQHLSPQFLADAVAKLDVVFAEVSYQSVTSPKELTTSLPVTSDKKG